MITSADNARVKQARALLTRRGRAEQSRCLAEGVRLIEDAMRAGTCPALIFFVADARSNARAAHLLDAAAAAGADALELAPAVFGTLSDTVSSQGVIAVLPLPEARLAPRSGPLLVLDGVRDPGNLGAILRSAEASDAGPVFIAPGATDPWSPKALRAGMGAQFRLPLRSAGWTELDAALTGHAVLVADAAGDVDYDQVDWTSSSALVIGGEAAGPGPEAAARGWRRVRIPMAGGAESLNAAVAASIILFEAARQRRA
jgi:TrmH family RNA methyltransferase